MRLSTAFIEDFKTRHSVVLGMTRSGKTFLAGKVLQGVQDIGGHTIFVDPKHDDGYAHLGTICHSPIEVYEQLLRNCLLYTSPSPRDMRRSRMPSSA